MLKNGETVNTQIYAPWEVELALISTEPLTGRKVAELEIVILTGSMYGKPNLEEIIQEAIQKACAAGDAWDSAYELFDVSINIKFKATHPLSEDDAEMEKLKLMLMNRRELAAYGQKIGDNAAADGKWDGRRKRHEEVVEEEAQRHKAQRQKARG